QNLIIYGTVGALTIFSGLLLWPRLTSNFTTATISGANLSEEQSSNTGGGLSPNNTPDDSNNFENEILRSRYRSMGFSEFEISQFMERTRTYKSEIAPADAMALLGAFYEGTDMFDAAKAVYWI